MCSSDSTVSYAPYPFTGLRPTILSAVMIQPFFICGDCVYSCCEEHLPSFLPLSRKIPFCDPTPR